MSNIQNFFTPFFFVVTSREITNNKSQINSSNTKIQTLLVVYDILGKEVATLVNKEQAPGTYEVKFNGEGLPSGIYIYKLIAGSYSSAKKMILLR